MQTRPVIIGSKPVANYALAVAARFGQGEEVVVLWDPLESTCRHASLSIL